MLWRGGLACVGDDSCSQHATVGVVHLRGGAEAGPMAIAGAGARARARARAGARAGSRAMAGATARARASPSPSPGPSPSASPSLSPSPSPSPRTRRLTDRPERESEGCLISASGLTQTLTSGLPPLTLAVALPPSSAQYTWPYMMQRPDKVRIRARSEVRW